MKKLAKLKGAIALSRKQQKEIFGGEGLDTIGGGGGGACPGTEMCVNSSDCPGSCNCIEDLGGQGYCR